MPSPIKNIYFSAFYMSGEIYYPKKYYPSSSPQSLQTLSFQQLSPTEKTHYITMANQGRVPAPRIPYFVEQSQHNRNMTQRERDKYPDLYACVPRLQGTGVNRKFAIIGGVKHYR